MGDKVEINLHHLTRHYLMMQGSFLIYNDINREDFGRDDFDNTVSELFSECNRYYFPQTNAYNRGDYIRINNMTNVFEFPENLAIIPKKDVFKTVIFEYRK